VLKRKANLTHTQRFRLRDLLRYNLQTVRAYLLNEDFQQFWDYTSPTWAGKFLDDWCQQAMRSRIEPMKKVARTLPVTASSFSIISGPKSSSQVGSSRA
jgi:transposase